jgi:hypothetical protein
MTPHIAVECSIPKLGRAKRRRAAGQQEKGGKVLLVNLDIFLDQGAVAN